MQLGLPSNLYSTFMFKLGVIFYSCMKSAKCKKLVSELATLLFFPKLEKRKTRL
jgi:hypothetical protein